jgi:hypothetical protein
LGAGAPLVGALAAFVAGVFPALLELGSLGVCPVHNVTVKHVATRGCGCKGKSSTFVGVFKFVAAPAAPFPLGVLLMFALEVLGSEPLEVVLPLGDGVEGGRSLSLLDESGESLESLGDAESLDEELETSRFDFFFLWAFFFFFFFCFLLLGALDEESESLVSPLGEWLSASLAGGLELSSLFSPPAERG